MKTFLLNTSIFISIVWLILTIYAVFEAFDGRLFILSIICAIDIVIILITLLKKIK